MTEGAELIPIPQELDRVKFSSESEMNTCVAVFASIKKAMELTEAGVKVNGQPMIVGLTNWHNFLKSTGGHETVWDTQLGMVEENVVFASTRDGWSKNGIYPYGFLVKHGKPNVKGIAEEGKKYISITGNNEGMSDFEDRALPSGAVEVRLFETGEIKMFDVLGEEERDPKQNELDELSEIFRAVYFSLKRITPEDKTSKIST